MKKILVVTMFFIFCFAPLVVMAEQSAVDKGNFELGVGNIIDIWLYRGDNYENATWIGLGTTPDLTVGYFIINGLMVGTTIGVTSYKSESWTEPNTSFFIQPVVKYYIPLSEKFFFNGKGFFGQYRENYAGDPDTYTRMRFGGGVAGTYMLLPSLGASFGVDFIYFANYSYGGTVDNTSYTVIDILLGLSVYL
ncbi:hypothetical protein ES705_37353 [subsurface metagenome]